MSKKRGGGYEWFVKIGEMQHDMIDFVHKIVHNV